MAKFIHKFNSFDSGTCVSSNSAQKSSALFGQPGRKTHWPTPQETWYQTGLLARWGLFSRENTHISWNRGLLGYGTVDSLMEHQWLTLSMIAQASIIIRLYLQWFKTQILYFDIIICCFKSLTKFHAFTNDWKSVLWVELQMMESSQGTAGRWHDPCTPPASRWSAHPSIPISWTSAGEVSKLFWIEWLKQHSVHH